MANSDPLADLLTRIRNAGLARLNKIEAPASRLKIAVAEILKKEGYVSEVEVVEDGIERSVEITLKYTADKRLAINRLGRISRPGRRVYARCQDIPRVKNGLGTCVVSTSQGVMTDKEARRRGIGGELVCEVW